jgi:hypothetical protein
MFLAIIIVVNARDGDDDGGRRNFQSNTENQRDTILASKSTFAVIA